MRLTRRALLKGLGAAGIAGAIGGPTLAGAIGAEPTYKVLEIFLPGGLSHRDTLWLFPQGAPACGNSFSSWTCRWGGQTEAWSKVLWGPGSPPATYEPADARRPAPGAQAITLGDARCSPALDPLSNPAFGASLLPRTRVVAMRNDTDVHELAVAIALGGTDIQRPDLFGLAAAVMRAKQAAHPANAVVLHPGVRADVVGVASSTGLLGMQYRPAALTVPDAGILDRLNKMGKQKALRAGIGSAFSSRYKDRLLGMRSDVHSSYAQSYGTTQRADDLHTYLSDVTLTSSSGQAPAKLEATLEAAKQLLKKQHTHHVTLLDPGSFTHYDTHRREVPPTPTPPGWDPWTPHATVHNHNLWWILRCLRTGANAVDFDKVLVVIHSEFGRALRGELSGHFPWGYAALLIGGPARGGSYGTWAADGQADLALEPRDLRAGMLYALGIDPTTESAEAPPLVPGPPLARDESLPDDLATYQYKDIWLNAVFGGGL